MSSLGKIRAIKFIFSCINIPSEMMAATLLAATLLTGNDLLG